MAALSYNEEFNIFLDHWLVTPAISVPTLFLLDLETSRVAEGFHSLANKCWPFHETLFEIVDPSSPSDGK